MTVQTQGTHWTHYCSPISSLLVFGFWPFLPFRIAKQLKEQKCVERVKSASGENSAMRDMIPFGISISNHRLALEKTCSCPPSFKCSNRSFARFSNNENTSQNWFTVAHTDDEFCWKLESVKAKPVSRAGSLLICLLPTDVTIRDTFNLWQFHLVCAGLKRKKKRENGRQR